MELSVKKIGFTKGVLLPVDGGIVNEVRWKNFRSEYVGYLPNRPTYRECITNASLKLSVIRTKSTSVFANMNKQHFWQQPGDTGARYTQWQNRLLG